MTPLNDLPSIFAALVLRPDAGDQNFALGISEPTLIVTTDQPFFVLAGRGHPIQSMIVPYALPGQAVLYLLVLRIAGHELRLVLDTTNREVRDCLLRDTAGCRLELRFKAASDSLSPVTVDLDPRFHADAMKLPICKPTERRVQAATDLLLMSCRELQPRFPDLPPPVSLRAALIACESTFRFLIPHH